MRIGEVLDDLSVDFGLVEDRAGRYARQLARSRQRAYLEASWRRLIVALAVGLAVVFLTFLLPRWARGFVAGAWLATVGWLIVYLVVQGSGTAPIMMGASAEQWTDRELRRLRRRGWRLVSHVMPSYGDVDHIAVGPGGLIVVETKWTSDPSRAADEDWLRSACDQVRRNTRQIRLALKARLRDAPVRAVLVCWSPGEVGIPSREPVHVTGVIVLPGAALRHWLDSLEGAPGELVSSADVDSSWETLSQLAQKTDQRELGSNTPVRRTPTRQLLDATIGIVAGLAFFFVSCLALQLLGVAAFGPVTVLAGIGIVFYRSARTSTATSASVLALGMLVGTSAFLAVAAALYSYFALVHR